MKFPLDQSMGAWKGPLAPWGDVLDGRARRKEDGGEPSEPCKENSAIHTSPGETSHFLPEVSFSDLV